MKCSYPCRLVLICGYGVLLSSALQQFVAARVGVRAVYFPENDIGTAFQQRLGQLHTEPFSLCLRPFDRVPDDPFAIHAAHEATKTNATSLETFQSPNRGVAGWVSYAKATWFARPVPKHTTASAFAGAVPDALPKVLIVYAHANVGSEFVDAAVAAGAKGIVLAGVGDGNATDTMVKALSGAAKKGVVVVRSSRVGSGAVVRNVELNDDQLGTVAAQELNPSKARVLLQLALTKTRDAAQVQKYFDEY